MGRHKQTLLHTYGAGYTALAHAAGHHPQLELARVLLEFGANVNQPTRWVTRS